jgi:cell division protein FtsL
MLRVFNLFLVLTALVAAFFLYSLEHRMRAGEREIASLTKAIANEREQIKLLHAEWSHLSRPSRLERLARERARMKPLQAAQIATEAELTQRLPERPAPNPAESPDDPLGEMLKVLQ